MARWPVAAGVVASTGASLILLACWLVPYDPPMVKEVFAACLVADVVAAAGLCRRCRWAAASLTLAAGVILLLLSLLPAYVEHAVPVRGRFTHHRHTLWQLGHVH